MLIGRLGGLAVALLTNEQKGASLMRRKVEWGIIVASFWKSSLLQFPSRLASKVTVADKLQTKRKRKLVSEAAAPFTILYKILKI